MTIKILNLYAGIGGNRKLWKNCEVTSVEIDEQIAGVYKSLYPKDEVIVGDAHQYLLDHYKEFDFIWSSPPCPTHSVLNYSIPLKRYPSMIMYQQILFLTHWFNVKPYYKPLIEPTVLLGRHMFWSNFPIPEKNFKNIDVSRSTSVELAKDLEMEVPKCNKARLLLRNAINPKIGQHTYEALL